MRPDEELSDQRTSGLDRSSFRYRQKQPKPAGLQPSGFDGHNDPTRAPSLLTSITSSLPTAPAPPCERRLAPFPGRGDTCGRERPRLGRDALYRAVRPNRRSGSPCPEPVGHGSMDSKQMSKSMNLSRVIRLKKCLEREIPRLRQAHGHSQPLEQLKRRALARCQRRICPT